MDISQIRRVTWSNFIRGEKPLDDHFIVTDRGKIKNVFFNVEKIKGMTKEEFLDLSIQIREEGLKQRKPKTTKSAPS